MHLRRCYKIATGVIQTYVGETPHSITIGINK